MYDGGFEIADHTIKHETVRPPPLLREALLLFSMLRLAAACSLCFRHSMNSARTQEEPRRCSPSLPPPAPDCAVPCAPPCAACSWRA